MINFRPLIWPFISVFTSWIISTQVSPTEYNEPPIVTSAYGKIVGTTSRQPAFPYAITKEFLGIPFAQTPPTRFLPAIPPIPHTTPIFATGLKPSCYQQFIKQKYRDIFNTPPVSESEDCLYLNIFTPAASTAGSGTPVLFWIHGGNFQLGSGQHPHVVGSSIAANENVIVVTMNYRLNVFGFPSSPDIPLEERNLGFQDQRLALKWVHENIWAFGGDPGKITVAGESVGAYSVKQLIAKPPDPVPFRAAILQSQSRGFQGDGVKSWDLLSQELGCSREELGSSQLACMQAVPADKIHHILDRDGIGFAPAIDGITDVGDFTASIGREVAAKVPILMGTNADEGTILAGIFPPPRVALEGLFRNHPSFIDRAIALYPPNATEFQLKSRIITDFAYTCATSALVTAFTEAGHSVWRYYFNASFPNTTPFSDAGVWHASEINLVFGNYPRNSETTTQQIQTSRYMQHAWSQFTKNPEGGPGWHRVGHSFRDVQVIGSNGTFWGESVDAKSIDHMCDVYWPAITELGRQ
ncbi:hypothetical protein BFJ71_g14546 [Fusarium oxysporum]|nr:hypothetical protein BFJ71_g14546 [Fusarium oxysporum]